MGREHYETDNDRMNQEFVAAHFSKHANLSHKVIPGEYSRQDFYFYKGDKHLVTAEIKCRYLEPVKGLIRWKQNQGYVIAQHKIDHLKAITDKRTVLIIGLNVCHHCEHHEGIFFTEIKPDDVFEKDYGGRIFNTRDEGDKEPIYFIPGERFIQVGQITAIGALNA